jgi:hypothetical protein
MGEGLSAVEVGHEIAHHAKHSGRGDHRDRWISIAEALLLSVVTLAAAWSGYSAAKWTTESSLDLAKASATRAAANREFQQALTFRVGDATTLNAWFGAYVAGDRAGVRVAERRFRPVYRRAFDAWLATRPFTNPNAPAGPQAMPQYVPEGDAAARHLDDEATALYAHGEHAAETGDEYVRVTVILASVLFLVGVSTQFPLRGGRYALVGVGALLLAFAAAEILTLPTAP